ncbi:MAG: hypothetical protein GX455_13610 [Phycisphaerae bacterium]|nr:hypothetical protein [Phycisphaerae bacterium]
MRIPKRLLFFRLVILAFSLNACGVVAVLHHVGQRLDLSNPADTASDFIPIQSVSHHVENCGLCQLLALTTGKIHLTQGAPDEGVERYVFCLTLPDHPVHRAMIRHFPARGPPTV